MSLLVDSGLAYCVRHHGVVECDGGDGPCDFVDPSDPAHRCPTCKGEGRIELEDGSEPHGCDDCDRGGVTLCDLRPLVYDAGSAS